MKIKNLSIVGISALAIVMSACPAATNTNTNTNTNANKNAVVVPANTTTPTTTNTANTTNTAASNTSAATDGQVIKLDEAGLVMTVPKGFNYSKDGEDTIVQSEDKGVDIRFTVPKDGDYNKIVTDAATEIDDYLKDVKIVEQGKKISIDGMDATTMSGTATNEGEPVHWDLTIINAPKRPVLANIYAEKASMEKYGAQVQAFFKSVKKQ